MNNSSEPFLALEENQFQYMTQLCERIEDRFIIIQKDLQIDTRNVCIP